jgi:serine/threonine protein kinase
MGVVYRAEDTRLSRSVALKFLPDELAGDHDAIRRLRREAQTIAALSHPNICAVYEVDEHEGSLFIVMEYADGLNLRQQMAERSLTASEVIDVALQITMALDAAHSAGIVHRDIKPENVVLVQSTRQAKVLDFGLARRFVLAESGDLISNGSTVFGRPIGTVNYMAPERILQMPLDSRCDLFSLGVLIYEMVSGRLPFSGASPADTVTNILENEPVPMATFVEPSADLERIVNRLLAKQLKSGARAGFFDQILGRFFV